MDVVSLSNASSESMGVSVPVGVATVVVVCDDVEVEAIPRISEIAAADLEAKLFAAMCRAR